MTRRLTFQEILEEKLSTPAPSPRENLPLEEDFCPFFLNKYQTHWTLDPSRVEVTRLKSVKTYPRKPFKRHTEKKDSNHCGQKTTLSEVVSVSELSIQQRISLQFFIEQGMFSEEQMEISKDEIKRAFKSLALKIHPDHSGENEHEKFLDLMCCYEVLLGANFQKIELPLSA